MSKAANIVDLDWERARRSWTHKTKNADPTEALSASKEDPEEKTNTRIDLFCIDKEEIFLRPSKEFEWKNTMQEIVATAIQLHLHAQSNLHSDASLAAKTKKTLRSTCHFVNWHASSSSTRVKHLAHASHLDRAALETALVAIGTHEQIFPRPPVRPTLPVMTTAKNNPEARLAKAISICKETADSQDTGERLALAIDLEAELGRLESEFASQSHPLMADAVSLLRDVLAFQYTEKLTSKQWDTILSSLRAMHNKGSSLSRVEVNGIHKSLLDAGLSTLPFTDKAEALLPDDG